MDAGALGALLHRHALDHQVPGAVLGVRRDGESVVACHGVADVRTRAAVTTGTRFGIGSLTKAVVATALVLAEADGRLRLDDLVETLVPELDGCPWAGRATVRALMSGRSRIPLTAATEFDGLDARDPSPQALARMLRTAAQNLPGDPGPDQWSYSNLGWCVAGRALESATGVPFEQALHQWLGPACGWTPYSDLTGEARRATGHDTTGGVSTPVPPLTGRAYAPAGTTLIATADELLAFAEHHLADARLATMRESGTALAIRGWFDAWCLGWGRFDWPGGTAWGWDGVLPGERATLRLLPEQRTAVVLLTNGDRGRALAASALTELMPELCGVSPPDHPAHAEIRAEPLDKYAGRYAWPDLAMTVTVESDHLQLLEDGTSARPAWPLGEGVFLLDRDDPDLTTMTFGPDDESGRPTALYRMLWGFPRQDQEGGR